MHIEKSPQIKRHLTYIEINSIINIYVNFAIIV